MKQTLMNKQGNTKALIYTVIGIVVGISIIVGALPGVFTTAAGFNASGIPSWVYTTVIVVMAGGVVYMVSKLFGFGK